MKGVLKKIYAGASASSGGGETLLSQLGVRPIPTFYTMTSFRWHLDSRPLKKIVAVPDLLHGPEAWQMMLRPIADFPAQGLVASEPLEIYCTELRGHNRCRAFPTLPPDDFVVANAVDALELQKTNLMTDGAKIVGFGLGAQIACQAALLNPKAFDEVCVFVTSVEDLLSYTPTEHNVAHRENLLELTRDTGITTLQSAREKLESKGVSAGDTALLLAMLEPKEDRVVACVDRALLERTTPFTPNYGEATYPGPLSVYVQSKEPVSEETKQHLVKHFPNAKVFSCNFEGQPFTTEGLPVAKLTLFSLNLLAKKNE